MKSYKFVILPFLLLILVISCEKNGEIDKQKPEIDLSNAGAFPMNCDTLYFGETFIFKVLFTDNVELGSFSIDIHNNFDHHSHSTEVSECYPDPQKKPVNPIVFIQDYSIPEGLKEYETNMSDIVPSANAKGSFDEGDYHFLISLTDKEGWSAQKGLSIKMRHRLIR